ncbi:phospholipase B1, membrane-associated-like isoform X2 [Zootermopsis nevadensis]|uniref:phospholipase B1, membrane-associated-like isoform X2 n=1 Tax=Zootermopsis nevadensis TaxID=136037 RepID=UPI000B8EA133|nr:phospholipase B1, membrane-associated-like isoform X2 [Zootermopsis nevadensis]
MSRNRAPVSGTPLLATRYTGPASDKTRHFQESFCVFCVFCVNVDCVCEIVQQGKSKFQEPVPDDSPFPCDTGPESPGARSATRPTSVHRLRPGDIDVVGAMGDSLTAGTGTAAAGLVELAVENRGMSWSGGGESTWREYLTLPNILREYNPALIGYSLKDSLGSEVNSQFNVAEPLAETRDMAFQAKLLVRRMRSDKRVNYKDDWKMVTMMIGSNDFCSEMCYLKDISVTSELHKKELTTALDYLRDNMPRTIVNLVAPPQLRIIQDFKGKSALCALINDVECPCLFGLRWQHLKDNFTQIMRDVQKTDLELATSGRYNSKDDFAVVGHRFLTEATIPNKRTPRGDVTDFSFLSEDCFHFSQKTHAMAANSLWNSLLEPVGNKTPHAVELPFSRFLCPAEESPYIFTDRNSVT